MPCEYTFGQGQTPEQRRQQVDDALRLLERLLDARRVQVRIGPDGAGAFAGWVKEDRAGVTDVCALRALAQQSSWPLRQAIARAEAVSGRKLNMTAVAAGVHSHDGGTTWHPGH